MNRLILLLFLSLSGFLAAQTTSMTAQEVMELKAKVKSTAEKTNSIQSEFTQLKHIDFLTHDIETQGKMFFKAPRLVKWQYTSPFQYTVIFKQDQILIDDGGNKSQVDIGSHKLFKELNDLIVSSVKGDMFKEDKFLMEYRKDAAMYVVTFNPKDTKIKEYIGSFVLDFEKTSGLVQSVKMIEPSGDYTLIIFKNRALNIPLSDAEFSN